MTVSDKGNETAGQRLAGKVAVITGAGRGIGRAHALLLAREGAKVVVNDTGGSPQGEGLDQRVADLVVEEIRAAGGEAASSYDNIATMEGGASLIKRALDVFGRLDIVINNAGNTRPRIIYNMSEEDWDAVIAVHLKGHFTTIRAASPIFREQRSGVIVNTSSESGLGHIGQANYSAAKEGIVGLTRTVARDLGRYNVRCNAIRPRAATRLGTEDFVKAVLRAQETFGVPAMGKNPVDRSFLESTPEQVATLAVWLCTDAAANINGRTFQVGGKMVGLYSEPEIVRLLYSEEGWSLDSLDRVATKQLTADLRNEFLGKGK